MDQLAAFDETIELAAARGLPVDMPEPTGLAHLKSMRDRITPDFSPAKLGRWLGYAQGVMVARGFATLKDVKEINRRHGASPAGIDDTLDLAKVPVNLLWQALRLHLLADMRRNGASTDYYLTHGGIGWTRYYGIPRQAVSAILEDLKVNGMVRFRNGLWTDDGMAGAGHALTQAGVDAANAMIGLSGLD